MQLNLFVYYVEDGSHRTNGTRVNFENSPRCLLAENDARRHLLQNNKML